MVRAYKPENLQNALAIKKKTRVIPMGGGTDLMVKRRRGPGLTPGFEEPVMFISHLEEIKNVELDEENIRIGSACSFASLLGNDEVPQVLKTAVSGIATPAIRNMGTIGGNICNASPAGDTLPVLNAMDASVVLRSMDEERTLNLGQFITAPGTTLMKEDELLTEVVIPKRSFDIIFYRKVGTGISISKVSFTGLAEIEKGRVKDIRISFGAVAPTVVRSRENEERLIGKTAGEIEKMIPEISSSYSVLIDPINDQRSNALYRRAVSLRLLSHFLCTELMPEL